MCKTSVRGMLNQYFENITNNNQYLRNNEKSILNSIEYIS